MTREQVENPKVQTPPSRQRIARGELGAQVMTNPLEQYLRLAEDEHEHEAGPSSRLNILSLMRNGSGGSSKTLYIAASTRKLSKVVPAPLDSVKPT